MPWGFGASPAGVGERSPPSARSVTPLDSLGWSGAQFDAGHPKHMQGRLKFYSVGPFSRPPLNCQSDSMSLLLRMGRFSAQLLGKFPCACPWSCVCQQGAQGLVFLCSELASAQGKGQRWGVSSWPRHGSMSSLNTSLPSPLLKYPHRH